MSILRIETKGDHVRNLLATRLKEFDRNIEIIDQRRLVAVAELERANSNVNDQLEAARARANAPAVGNRNQFDTVGLGGVYDAKQQVSHLANAIEGMRYQRAQVSWLMEQFKPDQLYQLDAGDLVVLGIGIGPNGRGGVFDPLDL